LDSAFWSGSNLRFQRRYEITLCSLGEVELAATYPAIKNHVFRRVDEAKNSLTDMYSEEFTSQSDSISRHSMGYLRIAEI
jgi:hypothetical protein